MTASLNATRAGWRSVRIAPVLLVVLLAGCAGSAPSGSGPANAPAAPSSPSAAAPNATDAAASWASLAWQGTPGSIPYGVWVCDGAAGQGCPAVAQPKDAWGWTTSISIPDGRFDGGNLTLRWTAAAGGLTDQLFLGAHLASPSCPSCATPTFGPDMKGPSPLSFPMHALANATHGMQLEIWVYGGPYQSAGPETVGVSGQQEFALDGQARVQTN